VLGDSENAKKVQQLRQAAVVLEFT